MNMSSTQVNNGWTWSAEHLDWYRVELQSNGDWNYIYWKDENSVAPEIIVNHTIPRYVANYAPSSDSGYATASGLQPFESRLYLRQEKGHWVPQDHPQRPLQSLRDNENGALLAAGFETQSASSTSSQYLPRCAVELPRHEKNVAFDEVVTSDEHDSIKMVLGNPGTFELLDRSFRVVADHWKFFVPGRVFATLWWEPMRDQGRQQGPEFVKYGEQSYANIRRLIVVCSKPKDYYSYCLEISTHGGRGAARKGLVQSQHAIVYTGWVAPQKLLSETGLHKEPLQIIPVDLSEELHPLSRLNLAKTYPVEHNVKVKEIGKIAERHLEKLIDYWNLAQSDYEGLNMNQLSKHLPEATNSEAANLPHLDDSKRAVGSNQGNRPTLHLAASTGNSNLIKVLLEFGALTEARDDEGRTALHCAAERGHETIARLLLDQTVDIEAKDNRGMTALDLAKENMHETMELLLLKSGAKLESQDRKDLVTSQQIVDSNHQTIPEFLKIYAEPLTATNVDQSDGSNLYSVFSIKPRLPSISSNSSVYSIKLKTTVEELTKLFFSDRVLRPLFLIALDSKSIGADRLKDNFRRLLKQFSADLRTEAHAPEEYAAARLAGSRARQIARAIRRIKQTELEGQEHIDLPIVHTPHNAKVDDDCQSSDLHELEQCDEENIKTLVDVKTFIKSSKAFTLLRHEFGQFVQPDMRQSICKEMEPEVEISGLVNATFQVHWDLLDYFKEELEGSPVLAPLLTITGSANTAYVTTCEAYMSRYWPTSGLDTLKTIQAGLDQEFYERQWASGLRFSVDLSAWHKESSDKHAVIKICGMQDQLTEIAQQLAWLSAVFRVPNYNQLTLSDVVLEKIDDENFKLFLLDLQPVTEKERSCWHPLFVNGVIARGFPTPPRQEEVGVELPFEVMIALGCVLYPMEYYEGLILKGFSTVLVPIARYSDSIQWHFICSNDDNERLKTSSIASHLSSWFETTDFDLLKRSRTFLGYCRNAEIHLGTHGLDYTSTKRSIAQDERPRLEISRKISASIGSSGLGMFGAMFGSEVVYQKSWHARTKSADLFLEDRLLLAREQPLLLYDTEKERGWLVPKLSVILHIVHIWASRQPDLLPSTVQNIPNAVISANRGMAAWDAILRGKLLKVRPEGIDGKPQLFIDVIKSFLAALESRTEEIVTREDRSTSHPFRQPGLRGWDLLDIVTREQIFGRKEVSIARRTGGKWDFLASENPELIVLFGEGIGEPIKPERHDKVCRTWDPVPEGKCYLTASVQCLKHLAAIHGGPSTCPKLTPRLHWHRPPEGKLFEACEFGVGDGCSRLQSLEEKKFNPPGPLEPNGAVIFGKVRKDDVSCCEPLKSQPVKEVAKTEQSGQPFKHSAIDWEHTDYDQDAISSYPMAIRGPKEGLRVNQLTEERKYYGENNIRAEGSHPKSAKAMSLSSDEVDDVIPKASSALPYSNGEGHSSVRVEQFNKVFNTDSVTFDEGEACADLAVKPIMETLDLILGSRKNGKKPEYPMKRRIPENCNSNKSPDRNGKMPYAQPTRSDKYCDENIEPNFIRIRPEFEDLKKTAV